MEIKNKMENRKLKCKKCGHYVENVGEKAKKVTCSDCVQKELNLAYKKQRKEEIK